MQQALESYLPPGWAPILAVLGTPLRWIPLWQEFVLSWSLFGDSVPGDIGRRVFLLLPALVVIVGVWATMLSLYTIPFRSQRSRYVTSLVLSWWDAGRSIWLFWVGIARLVAMFVGWIWSGLRFVLRLAVLVIKGLTRPPLAALEWTSRRSFEAGVPWVAFALTALWSALEATVFTYVVLGTVVSVLGSVTGFAPGPYLVAPVLWVALLLLIAGSFASLEVLARAVQSRNVTRIVQMAVVQLSVMAFEVFVLYAELVDAVTVWVAPTGEALRLGLVTTLVLATLGWVGVRSATWFLFGRAGSPAVRAVISRETVAFGEAVARVARPTSVFREAVGALQAEVAWFRQQAHTLLELLSVPVLQLLATAINFLVVLVRSEPVFRLPFRDLNAALAATPRFVDRPVPRRATGTPAIAGETTEGVRQLERPAEYVA